MNRTKIISLTVMACLGCTVAMSLTSCVIKPYKRPATAVENNLYRVDTSRLDSVTIADIPWRQFFKDPQLCLLIDSVLVNNLDLQIAVRNIDKMYAYLRQSRAAFAPSINSSLGVNDMFKTKTDGDTPGIQASLGVSWEIDIWGKILSAKRSAQAKLMAEEDTHRAITTTLISETAKAYYQLVALDIEREIIEGTIANRAEYLEKTRTLKKSAKVNEVAVQQALAQMAEVMAALPEIELAIETVENQISMLLGTTPRKIDRSTVVDLESVEFSENIGYPIQLLSNRPDVRAAEMEYRAAFEQYNVSRASLYPALTLGANGDYGASLTNIVNSHFGTLNLLAGLTQPIFNARKLRTQKNIDHLSAQQAQLSFQQTILKAGMEVSNALISTRKYREKAINQRIQLVALRKAYDYSTELFVNGYATYLDVLVAQTGVYNTQISLINTLLSGINSRIDLYRSLGGGVQ